MRASSLASGVSRPAKGGGLTNGTIQGAVEHQHVAHGVEVKKSIIDVVDVLLRSAYDAAYYRKDLSLTFTQTYIHAFHLLDRARLDPTEQFSGECSRIPSGVRPPRIVLV